MDKRICRPCMTLSGIQRCMIIALALRQPVIAPRGWEQTGSKKQSQWGAG